MVCQLSRHSELNNVKVLCAVESYGRECVRVGVCVSIHMSLCVCVCVRSPTFVCKCVQEHECASVCLHVCVKGCCGNLCVHACIV